MRFYLFLVTLLAVNIGFGQTVFSETFDEADDATSGVDNTAGAVSWTTTCPGSVAVSDYFKVLSGSLDAKDTNSPGATWETGNIDITSCTEIIISFSLEEESPMEECADCGGTGTICIDWVKLEYNLDGAGWTEVAGSTCALVESPGEMIQIGDIAGGGPITYTSPCIDFGTTLAIRISCMSWAADEIWRFDDITVACNDCVLPVTIVDFKATEIENGAAISWSTLNEQNNDHFIIERSYNGKSYETISIINGAGNSTHKVNYEVLDNSVEQTGTVYYRLQQFDFDGNSSVIKTTSINLEPEISAFYTGNEIRLLFKNRSDQPLLLNIYNLNGQLINQSDIAEDNSILWTKKGFYIIEIPVLNFHQKLIID